MANREGKICPGCGEQKAARWPSLGGDKVFCTARCAADWAFTQYTAIEETLEIMGGPAMAGLRESIQEAERGKLIPLADVKAELRRGVPKSPRRLMRVLCKSQLLLVGGMDQISCSLDEGHDGFHSLAGTVPAYHDEDEIDGSVMDDPEVDYAIVWN